MGKLAFCVAVLRCSALILSVNHLVLLTKKTGTVSEFLDWVDQSLADVEDHLQVGLSSSCRMISVITKSLISEYFVLLFLHLALGYYLLKVKVPYSTGA